MNPAQKLSFVTADDALSQIDYHITNNCVRLSQDLSCFHLAGDVEPIPDRSMYIPLNRFDTLCFMWLTSRGYWIEYPKGKVKK